MPANHTQPNPYHITRVLSEMHAETAVRNFEYFTENVIAASDLVR